MLFRSEYFWRLYLGYMLVILTGALLVTLFMAQVLERWENRGLERDLQAYAQLLAMSVKGPLKTLDYPQIRETVAGVAEVSGLRLTVIDANGVVLADSHENPYAMDNHLRRPEVQSAHHDSLGQTWRYSQTLGQSFHYLALALRDENRITGYARVARSNAEISAGLRDQQLSLMRYAAFFAFALLLLAFFIAARQAAAVEELTAVAEVVSKGDYERRISESNASGLKRLAEVINQMARSSAQTVSDITADRNRLSTLFAGMVEGVIDVDLEQRIVHINGAAAKLLRVDENACLGRHVWEEIRSREITEVLDEAIKSHGVIKKQMRLTRGAEQLVVDLYAASLDDDSGESIGAVIVLNDVTELKNLERVRSDFVANASHELKTPITAIRGFSETIMREKNVERKTINHYMKRIHAQSMRLSQLISDLMMISRLESAQQEELDMVNMAGLAAEVAQGADEAVKEKDLTLTTDLPAQAMEVHGDRENLHQLVNNLVDNAIKYTPPGGEIKITLREKKGKLKLEVEDSGIGISPQFHQRIFERFYRIDKVRSQSLGGTGLGLSIVKNIAERHGGSVSVDSQLGMGARFTFTMALA